MRPCQMSAARAMLRHIPCLRACGQSRAVHAFAGSSDAPLATVAVYVTVPTADVGRQVAAALIESKLAACVSMIPGVESMYWWEGKVETETELLLMIKSRASLVDALTTRVKEIHPYDTPEVIAVPITGGSDAYIKWLLDATRVQRPVARVEQAAVEVRERIGQEQSSVT